MRRGGEVGENQRLGNVRKLKLHNYRATLRNSAALTYFTSERRIQANGAPPIIITRTTTFHLIWLNQ